MFIGPWPARQNRKSAIQRAHRSRPLARCRNLTFEFLEARAMLSATPNLGVLLLDPSGRGALSASGNGGGVVVSNGDLVVDSSNSSAGLVSGNENVSATNIYVAGKLSGGKISGTLHTASPAETDPLAALPTPTAPATKFTNTVISGNRSVTLSPGTYVGGIKVIGNANVTLLPGLYYLQGGLNVNGNAKLTGTGVTLYNASGAIDIAGNAILMLTAPSSGTYQGIAIFQNRPSSTPLTFSSAGFRITGEVYAPAAGLTIAGNSTETISGNGATIPGALIVRDLSMSGNCSVVVSANAGGPTGDLSITKTDDMNGSSITSAVGAYSAGSPIIYYITVANTGPSAAVGATVSDLLPVLNGAAAFTTSDAFTVTTTGGAVDDTNPASGSGNISSDVVVLPANSSITYAITANVSAASTGQLSNTATITPPAGFNDTNSANNTATDVDNLTADLAISITDNTGATGTQGQAAPGATIQYTVKVSNNGPGGVLGATVADTFPAADLTGDTFTVSTTGGAADATNPTGATGSGINNINDAVDLPAGSSITYVVTAAISATATGTLSNSAKVTPPANVVDPNLANNSATDTASLVQAAALTVQITDTGGGNSSTNHDGGVYEGVPVTYTITISNSSGPSNLTGVTVSFPISSYLTGEGYSVTQLNGGATDTNPTGSGGISDMIDLPVGSSITYSVLAMPNDSGTPNLTQIVNVATATLSSGAKTTATDTDLLTDSDQL